MTELAVLSLRLRCLPSQVLAEDPEVIDEMIWLLDKSEEEPKTADPSDLAARMAGRG